MYTRNFIVLRKVDPGTWRHCRNSGLSNLRFFILMQSSIILVTNVVKYNPRTNFFRDLISYFELKNGQSFTYVCIFYSLWEIREMYDMYEIILFSSKKLHLPSFKEMEFVFFKNTIEIEGISPRTNNYVRIIASIFDS